MVYYMKDYDLKNMLEALKVALREEFVFGGLYDMETIVDDLIDKHVKDGLIRVIPSVE